jgi:hypothetical protein
MDKEAVEALLPHKGTLISMGKAHEKEHAHAAQGDD